jgi:hypothetical protein
MPFRLKVLITILFYHIAFAQAYNSPAVSAFLDKVSYQMARLAKDYPQEMTAITQIREMDSRWQAKTVTWVEKKIFRSDSLRQVEIVRAIKREGDRETDVTVQHRQGQGNNKRSLVISSEDLFPFDPERRGLYDFELAQDSTWSGKTVKVLIVNANEKGENYYNGRYYISPDSFTVVAVSLSPSKFPKMVKSFNMCMNLGYDENGHYIARDFWMRVYANFLIKKIRFEIFEEYKDRVFLGET